MAGNAKARALSLVRGGRTAEAQRILADACRLCPVDPELWFLRGALNEKLGVVDSAKADYLQAIRLRAGYTDALNNLGALCEVQGDLDGASDWYRRAADADLQSVAAQFNLGRLCGVRRNWAEAEHHLRIASRLAPHDPRVHFNLAIALKARGAGGEAIDALRTVLRLDPRDANARNMLGNALQTAGSLEEAVTCYQEVLRGKPDFAVAQNNLGSALLAQARHAEAEQAYSRAVALRPDWAGAWSNALLVLNYTERAASEIFERHRGFGFRFCGPGALSTGFSNTVDPERTLRIGYVSGDFRAHSVAYFFVSILGLHDRSLFKAFCYSNVESPDDTTEYLKGLCDQWRDIRDLSDIDAAAMIRRDRIDILVDLAGHTAHNRLPVFVHRPAPVQITYLGYPGTTGLPVMDYRITDAVADEPGATEQWHVERLLRLPKGFLCYRPPPEAPGVSPAPVSVSGHVTFGSFNNLAKVTSEVVSVWSSVLLSVPDSKLVIKGAALADRATRIRFQELFSTHGITGDRLAMVPRSDDITQHLQFYSHVDIALDPFPYNGTTTTCEALWMGVPVVALAGKTHSGRVGASILKQMGLDDCVGMDRESYVRIAVDLAGDPNRVSGLRRVLRNRMKTSSLCDADDFIRRLEDVYRGVWRDWCARSDGAGVSRTAG